MDDCRYFIDTNIFLRVIAKDNLQKATDCERLLRAIREGKLRAATSHLVCAEFVWTCLSFYRLQKSDVIQLLRSIVSIPHLMILDEYDLLRALELYERANVKFIDALIASHSAIVARGFVVISYDRDFDALKIKRVEPHEALRKMTN